jgi:hypothetical protein
MPTEVSSAFSVVRYKTFDGSVTNCWTERYAQTKHHLARLARKKLVARCGDREM